MLYHGFYVKFTPLENIQREKKDGSIALCGGFQIEIFSDSSEKIPLDAFTAAVGLEILNNSWRNMIRIIIHHDAIRDIRYIG